MKATDNSRWKKVRQPTVLAVLCAIFLIASILSANPINNSAERSASTLIASTTVTYIALRSINSVLSAAQEAKLEGTLAVIAGEIAPLKALEPIDDTVERMSTGIFLVAAFSALLSIAFNPLAGFGWALLVCYFGIRIWVDLGKDSTFWEDMRAAGLDHFFRFLIQTGVGLGLVLPISFIASVHFGDYLTESAWQNSQTIFNDIATTIEDISPGDKVTALEPTPPGTSGTDAEDSIPSASDASSQFGLFSGIANVFAEGRDSIVDWTKDIASSSTALKRFAQSVYTEIRNYTKIAGVVVSRADDLLSSMLTILAVLVFKSLILPVIVSIVLMGVIKTTGIQGGFGTLPRALLFRRSTPEQGT